MEQNHPRPHRESQLAYSISEIMFLIINTLGDVG